jgi:hypothetical protein
MHIKSRSTAVVVVFLFIVATGVGLETVEAMFGMCGVLAVPSIVNRVAHLTMTLGQNMGALDDYFLCG